MPVVTIIIPCYNEQATIRLLLDAIYSQSFPHKDMEVIISDGMSSDMTRQEIENFQTEHQDIIIRVVDNLKRNIPSALNTALKYAGGQFIVRLDAHSIPERDYVKRCVEDLQKDLGSNVGGVWEIQPSGKGWMSESIATAAGHPLGAGDARYRMSSAESGIGRAVDTVPFGAYPRELFDKIGGFNESLLTNEDYEFNTRIRQSGGIVWLDPAIRSRYFARADLGALLQQYARYGFWKARMLKRYPHTLRWRQLLPPLFVFALIATGFLGVFLPLIRWLFFIICSSYVSIISIAGLHASWQQRKLSLAFGFPLSIASMHLAWGSAFLWSLCKPDGR